VLRNTTLDAWERAGRPVAGSRSGEADVLAHARDGSPVQRYAATPPVPGTTGDIEALAMYAGRSTGIVNRQRPAAAIVREFAREAAKALGAVHPDGEDRAAA